MKKVVELVKQQTMLERRDDPSVWPTLARLEVMGHLVGLAEQVEAIRQQIKDEQDQRQQFLKTYREAILGQAQLWHWISLIMATVAFGVFIYFLICRFQAGEPLASLEVLIPLLSGILMPLFFRWYTQSMQRMVEERDKIRREKEIEGQMGKIEAIYAQMQKQLQDLEMASGVEPTGATGVISSVPSASDRVGKLTKKESNQ